MSSNRNQIEQLNSVISERLYLLRTQNGYTQDYIGNYLNISRQCYHQYEAGIKKVPLYHLVALAKFYKITLDYFVPPSLYNGSHFKNCELLLSDLEENDSIKPHLQKIKSVFHYPISGTELFLLYYYHLLPEKEKRAYLEFTISKLKYLI